MAKIMFILTALQVGIALSIYFNHAWLTQILAALTPLIALFAVFYANSEERFGKNKRC